MPKTLYACTIGKDLYKPFAEYHRVLAEGLVQAAYIHIRAAGLPILDQLCHVRSRIGQWYLVQIHECTQHGAKILADIRTVGDVTDMAKSGMLMPARKGTCPECGTPHPPDQPHNQQSLLYQYSFYRLYDRWPTWWDALEHCPPDIRQHWLDELAIRGVTVEDPNKDFKEAARA
jgi:hypothetical protein